MSGQLLPPTPPSQPRSPLGRRKLDWRSLAFTAATSLATFSIVAMVALILGNILWLGGGQISLHFIFGGTSEGMFDAAQAGVFPMIFGTVALVILMTLGVVPVGVITAIYLVEYGRATSPITRIIRGAINNLAGVPSIVFGLFGLGFFVMFVGGLIDRTAYGGELHYRQPALLWAAATMAVMTLPVMIVATEEALRAVPRGLREGSLALGATKLETIRRIVLPQALPGILTGAILAVGRGAGKWRRSCSPARPTTWPGSRAPRPTSSCTSATTCSCSPPNRRISSAPSPSCTVRCWCCWCSPSC